jgi:SGNH hydrolase-like domain, acetyltransferase AlgX
MKAKIIHIAKYSMFVVILFVISIPALQHYFEYRVERPLNGAITIDEYEPISWETWFSGEYQENTETYFNSNFGFRSEFIRINNQRHYWFYRYAKANEVVVGKESYLYENNYIKAYYGTDWIGQKAIDEKTRKLKFIQQKLKESGTDLYVVFAPGKGSYCSEFIPNSRREKKRAHTNYSSYKGAFKKNGVNYIDFRSWFMEMKEDTPYPLFAKAGIHWSKYGEFIAADSLLKKVGEIRSAEMPKLILDNVVVDEKNREGDYDIGEGMNLFFDLPTFPMGYPQFHIEQDTSITQQKVLFVADSYFWGIFNRGLSRDVFGDGRFWYYNQGIYPDSYKKPIKVKDIDIKAKSEENDVIIILSTDANLYKFAFGFIDQLYEAYQD